jgi:ABC-type phosphate transport system substrate-binding protein
MRALRTLIAGVAAGAAMLALTASPALADPPARVTPRYYDVVSVGSDTDQSLFDQLSVAYNAAHKTHNPGHPWIYSWDATNPKTGATGDLIRTKAGSKTLSRPNGSNAGISVLQANAKTTRGTFSVDFARSSRARKSTDPKLGKNGIAFVTLARDAVTYSTQSKTNAPSHLSTADLTKIYTCTVRTWNQVGGTSHATIQPFLPPSTSGTRTFFLGAIDVTTPGSCVNSTPEQNEGTNKLLHTPNAIFPYSVADYIAQVFHSPACGHKPKPGQNAFGCDEHGTLKLNTINGTSPTVGKGARETINPRFSPAFMRFIYDVVRYSTSTRDHIPANLEPFFASASARVKGWFCTAKTAKNDITDYGFLTTPFCGSVS